uniref:Uncharacterized protein n=1 Tax=Nelumbo nucifera TaxID=4432 RepID=A0A822YW02_NELNU|nr:TPA_asm: hypothetical protein HUJ06_007358 [Nelumbo nucifera]
MLSETLFYWMMIQAYPFSVDDTTKSMQQFNISDIEPPPLIHENSGFLFLLTHSE